MATSKPANVEHMPVNMDPAAYTYVGAFDNEPPPGSYVGPGGDFKMDDGSTVFGTNWLNAQDSWLKSLLHGSATSRYGEDRGWQCDHCGAHIRYVAVLRHTPTGDCIAVGDVCLDNRFTLRSKADFDRLRKAAALDRGRQRLLAAERAFLAKEVPPEHVLAVEGLCDDKMFAERNPEPSPLLLAGRAHHIVADMRRRLRQYSSLSPKQVAFAAKLMNEALHPPAPKDEEVWVDAPSGRVEVRGTILATKYVEGYMGDETLKMLVACEGEGGRWKLWVTVPSKLGPIDKGDVIKLCATVQPSEDDPAFAFGKRLTRAEVLERKDEEEA